MTCQFFVLVTVYSISFDRVRVQVNQTRPGKFGGTFCMNLENDDSLKIIMCHFRGCLK